MLGSIFVGWLSDPVIKWISKKNNGVYEPEFRLVFMGVALVFCVIGMCLFGYTMSVGSPGTHAATNYGTHFNSDVAALCAFFQGMMMFGVLIGIFATLSYALDAFRSQSNEIFIMNMLFKVRKNLCISDIGD